MGTVIIKAGWWGVWIGAGWLWLGVGWLWVVAVADFEGEVLDFKRIELFWRWWLLMWWPLVVLWVLLRRMEVR